MSIFKKKSNKPAKAADTKSQPAVEAPKPAAYRPRHETAVSSTTTHGSATGAATGPWPKTRTPSATREQQRVGSRTGPVPRHTSPQTFTTNRNAPPLPTSHSQSSFGSAFRQGIPRNGSDAFTPGSLQTPNFDSPILGNPKMALAAQMQGYFIPPSDSGYGSAGPSRSHSRTPSVQHNRSIEALSTRPSLARNESFLPELSFGEPLSREASFTEQVWPFQDQPIPATLPKKMPESALKGAGRPSTQSDGDGFGHRSTESVTRFKSTRFEDAPNRPLPGTPVQDVDPVPGTIQSAAPTTTFVAEPWKTHCVRPESATIPKLFDNLQLVQTLRHDVPQIPSEPSEHVVPAASEVSRCVTPPAGPLAGPLPALRPLTPVAAAPPRIQDDWQSSPVSPIRTSSPTLSSSSTANDLYPQATTQHSTRPSMSLLEGFRVNKQGRVLNEEGDLIGELVQGDILDCVRQRVNAFGEVIDDYGNTVGHVKTVTKVPASELPRSNTPVPEASPPRFRSARLHDLVPRSLTPPTLRRESIDRQREVFTPEWQQLRSPSLDLGLARELRDFFATENQVQHSPLAGNDSLGVTAVELPASEPSAETKPLEDSRRDSADGEIPLFDHSDVFLPAPFIPARSIKRSASPQPRVVEQQSRPKFFGGRLSLDSMSTKAARRTPPTPIAVNTQPAPAQAPASGLPPQRRSPELKPEQPAAVKLSPPPSPRRSKSQTLLRSMSDSSVSELVKSYARPSMDTVPEDGDVVAEKLDPSLFSYKGDIPTESVSAAVAVRPAAPLRPFAPKMPSMSSLPRHAMASGTPGMPFGMSPLPSASFNTRRGPAHFTTGTPGPRATPSARNSFNAPLRRSPLSSHESTPPTSDEGSDEDAKSTIPNASDRFSAMNPGRHSRAPSLRSVRTVASIRSTWTAGSSKTMRTYFTHAGRVTVELDEDGQPPVSTASRPTSSTSDEKKEASKSMSRGGSLLGSRKEKKEKEMSKVAEKKEVEQASPKKSRGRFSFGFGAKKAVVAAH